MIVKKVNVVSLAKILSLLYAAMGLFAGMVFALFALFGMAIGSAAGGGSMEPLFGVLFGGGAVIVLPIFYGVMGFLAGLIGGAVFNLAAHLVGGLELEVV